MEAVVSMRSLPQETVWHELLLCDPIPGAAVPHNLLQHASLHVVQSFGSRLLQHGFLMGSQVLPANLLRCRLLSPQGHKSCQMFAPAQASHGLTDSFGHSPVQCGILHGLQGNFCSSTWSTFSPPSALTLISAGLLLSHILSPLLSCCWAAGFFFPSGLCYPRGVTTITDGFSVGQWWVCPAAGWYWLCQT